METDPGADPDHYCRICRSGPEDGPLYHPCRCRGSVKYVHDDCLKQWLTSSKKEKKCDICGSKYTFEPIISPDAPHRLNSAVVAAVMVRTTVARLAAQYAGSVLAVALFGVLFPLTLMFSLRFSSSLIDGRIPKADIWRSVFAGNADTVAYDFEYTWANLWQCFRAGYPLGLKLFVVVGVTVVQAAVLHEWVTRDKGFADLMNMRVGDPVACEYVDEFIRTFLQEMFGEGVAAARGTVTRAELARLVELHGLAFMAQARTVALMDASPEKLEAFYARARADAYNKLKEIIPWVDDMEPEFADDDPIVLRAAAPAAPQDGGDARGDYARGEDGRGNDDHVIAVDVADVLAQMPTVGRRHAAVYDDFAHGHFGDVDSISDDTFDADDADTDSDSDFDEGPEPIADIDDLDQDGGFGFNIRVDVQGGVKIFFAMSALFLVVVKSLYFLPSRIGNAVFAAYYSGARYAVAWLLESRAAAKLSSYRQVADAARAAASVVRPLLDQLDAVYEERYPVSLGGRLVPLATDAVTFFFVSRAIMWILERPFRERYVPLKGRPRTLYYVLFDIHSVVKVNIIFATEIVAFPTFCGALLDFVFSPVFVPSADFFPLSSAAFTSSLFFQALKRDKFFIFVSYWAVGTLYMCLFATYVGMVRKFILRPGVLFFIKSPDDHHTRLIHDALVRPFGLQMSRIFLSGAVYTAFILPGFGVITFPLRYFTPLLPMKINLFSTFLFASAVYFYTQLYGKLVPSLRKFVRIYWFYAMRKAARLTRLSSFMLGIERVDERGRTVYRSLYHRIWTRETPDYDSPVDEDDVQQFFAENPDRHSVFVPDGNWVRAPDDDNVSRLYLKNLFYPVRRDGSDFDAPRSDTTARRRTVIDNLLGERDEIDEIRTHVVVFRPPQFGLRNFMFVAWLWFFAGVFITAMLFVAHVLGIPVAFLCSLPGRVLPNWMGNLYFYGFYDEHIGDHWFQATYSTVFHGLLVELVLMRYIDKAFRISSIKRLNKGKRLFKSGIRRVYFGDESHVILSQLVNMAVKIGQINIWCWLSLAIQRYLVVAILDDGGLKRNQIASDVRHLLQTQELGVLLEEFVAFVRHEFSTLSIFALVIQLAVAVVLWIRPAYSIISDDYTQIGINFRDFIKPQLAAAIVMGLYSLFYTGSVVPGLLGDINSLNWEISFGFALVYYTYQQLGQFYREMILKREEEIRLQYYKIGEQLINCDF